MSRTATALPARRAPAYPCDMYQLVLAGERPCTRTKVGRLLVEKKCSGSTPSAGAAANRASGAVVNGGFEKSGPENVVTPERYREAGSGKREAGAGSGRREAAPEAGDG